MLKVGYVPYSKDLQHPGDRRRLASWAESQRIDLKLVDPLDSDVLVLSNAAHFDYWIKAAKQPVILDLVDGYLGEEPTLLTDILRNLVRSFRGKSDVRWIRYTSHLKSACKRSSAIIVASPEQRDLVLPFNENVFVILDNHSELLHSEKDLENVEMNLKDLHRPMIFWEGFGYTLKHFKHISKVLDEFLHRNGWGMILVTVEAFPRWGGYIGNINTQKLIKRMFPLSHEMVRIKPWSIQNLINYSRVCRFGIIPIDPEDKFGSLKSENKLLSNWLLGVNTICSLTPAYARVESKSNSETFCVNSESWSERLEYFRVNCPSNLDSNAVEYLKLTHSATLLNEKWNKAISAALRVKP